jgi:hypothetical protein
MAEKKTDTSEEGVLAAAAKAIGGAAGKVAGLAKAGGRVKRVRIPEGRILKKNKSRLPRRQKKALAKKTLAKQV